jgi:hypothetical protein
MSLIFKRVYFKKIGAYNDGKLSNLSTSVVIKAGHINLLKQRNLNNDWFPDYLNLALKNNQTEIVDYIYKTKKYASADYMIYLAQYCHEFEMSNYFTKNINSWQMNVISKMAEQFGHDTIMRIILWLRSIE